MPNCDQSSRSADGQCLCGEVRYRVAGSIGEVRLCHCTRCQRATGSAFSANARILAASFTLLDGQKSVRTIRHVWPFGHVARICRSTVGVCRG